MDDGDVQRLMFSDDSLNEFCWEMDLDRTTADSTQNPNHPVAGKFCG